MNLRLLLTTTALLTAALVVPSVSQAVEPASSVKNLKANTSTSPTQSLNATKMASPHAPSGKTANEAVIARVQPHQIADRMAATLYVRNIPVLTFVGSTPVTTETNIGENDVKQLNAPILRAHAVAAKINKMALERVDAGEIKAVWQPSGESKAGAKTQSQSDRYLIKVKDAVLVEFNSQTRLPDTIGDRAKDSLQATNRLRKLIGNAPPLNEISGKQVMLPPDKFLQEVTVGLIRSSMSGLASWYDFKENGSATASGEVFSDNGLTAAHLTLPFGTQVRVTNRLNGRSVIVRINDRGPYVGGRVIDLSTTAANLIGMIEPGVVPVDVDVLGQPTPKRDR